MHVLRLAATLLATSVNADPRHARQRAHRGLIDRAEADGIRVPTFSDDALCLGVADQRPRNNQAVVLQPCDDPKTARWRHRNGALKTGTNMCLDVPDGRNVNGQPLQVYRCYTGNKNQQWESRDGHLIWRGSNKSVDVTDGCFSPDTPLQLWDAFSENTNQVFALAGLGGTSSMVNPQEPASTSTRLDSPSSASPTQAQPAPTMDGGALLGPGSFSGYTFISFDAFMRLHPVLNPLRQDILDAAASVNIGLPPILLAAQALQESSGNPYAGNGGLGQFKPSTWDDYGENGNMYNGRDNLFAMARYLKALLGTTGNNLDEALRIYSGGLSFYQGDIRSWLRGDYVYGEGT